MQVKLPVKLHGKPQPKIQAVIPIPRQQERNESEKTENHPAKQENEDEMFHVG